MAKSAALQIRKAPASKAKEPRPAGPEVATQAPETKPVREKAPAKPAREKSAPKVETAKPDQSAGAAAPGDDSWNGPMPGFLSVGFGT